MGAQVGKLYRIDDRNRIVISPDIIEKFKLQEGDSVIYELEDDGSIKLCFHYLDRKRIRKLSEVKP